MSEQEYTQEYTEEVKRLFGADRYWSAWEQGAVEHALGLDDPPDPQDLVYELNDAYARRQANRNV